jgi:hypothetical protein
MFGSFKFLKNILSTKRVTMRALWMKVGLAIILLFIVLGLAGVSLAAFGWTLPGNVLFPLQQRIEQALIIGSKASQADRYLDLVERRIENLQARAGTPHELAALEALGFSIDQAQHMIAKTPNNQANELLSRYLDLLIQVDPTLNSLVALPNTHGDLLTTFQTRLHALITSISSGRLLGGLARHQPELTAQMGTGLDGTSPVRAFFPLTGGHAGIDCLDCHITGEFQGTTKTCLGCHVDATPAGHYHAECDLCHTINNWQEITWEHTNENASDCYYCHEWDAPHVHYPGQCSECHVSTGWVDGTTFHSEPSNCWTCHAEEAPAHHYLGVCSSCHTTNDWAEVTFVPSFETNLPEEVSTSHVDARCSQCHGEARCSSCHENTQPAEHFNGQCSQCHVTDDWQHVTFLHTPDADCRSCHTDTAPANHYPGQCLACHTFDGWAGAIFNHVGFTDCRSCHAATAPANHYPGQCSNCHNLLGWANVNFSHAGLTDCASCHAGTAPPNHYDGQCSLCHTPSGWANVNFNHSGLTDCISCHADDAPPDHFDGQCSQCHTPTTWSNVNFNHDGYTDCISCHEDDRPDDHPQAQCSICHNTSSWEDAADRASITDSSLLLDSTLSVACGDCHPQVATIP